MHFPMRDLVRKSVQMDQMRNSPRMSIKITLYQVRTGGRAVVRRLAEKLGYAHVTVNLMELMALEQDRPHQRQLLKQLISQHSANAQFIVWYHVIVHITYFMLPRSYYERSPVPRVPVRADSVPVRSRTFCKIKNLTVYNQNIFQKII